MNLFPSNCEILAQATAFRFGQSSWIQNAYFFRKLFTTRFPNEGRRKYAVQSSRCSKVELYRVWFGTWVERHLDRALNMNLKTVNFSSIDSTGSGRGSYVFKRRGEITKKKVDWRGVELSSSAIVLTCVRRSTLIACANWAALLMKDNFTCLLHACFGPITTLY